MRQTKLQKHVISSTLCCWLLLCHTSTPARTIRTARVRSNGQAPCFSRGADSFPLILARQEPGVSHTDILDKDNVWTQPHLVKTKLSWKPSNKEAMVQKHSRAPQKSEEGPLPYYKTGAKPEGCNQLDPLASRVMCSCHRTYGNNNNTITSEKENVETYCTRICRIPRPPQLANNSTTECHPVLHHMIHNQMDFVCLQHKPLQDEHFMPVSVELVIIKTW